MTRVPYNYLPGGTSVTVKVAASHPKKVRIVGDDKGRWYS
jgi:hypothetical protein